MNRDQAYVYGKEKKVVYQSTISLWIIQCFQSFKQPLYWKHAQDFYCHATTAK